MRGRICDWLSGEPVERAGGEGQQSVDMGQRRRWFVLKRETWGSRRMDGSRSSSAGWRVRGADPQRLELQGQGGWGQRGQEGPIMGVRKVRPERSGWGAQRVQS